MRSLTPSLVVLIAALPAAAQDSLTAMRARFDGAGYLEAATGRSLVAPGGLDEARLADTSRQVLEDLAGVLGVPAPSLREARRGGAGGILTWTAEQHVDGRRVVGSRVDLQYLRDGHLMILRANGLLREPDFRPAYPLSRRDATELARVAAPFPPAASVAWAPEAVVLATEDRGPRAVYRVFVADAGAPRETWSAWVDAGTGEVLRLESNAVNDDLVGAVDGRGIPSGTMETGGPPVVAEMENLWVSALHVDGALGIWTENGCDEERPAVAGSGARIAYVSDCAGSRDVWIMGPGGVGATALDTDPGDDRSPTVGGTGDTVVFVSDRTGADQLWRVAHDGTGLAQITFGPGTKVAPRVDEAETTVYFASDADGDFEIWSVGVDGSGLKQLTDNASWDGQVDVADGLLTFASDRDGDPEIFTMGLDGTFETQLTFNEVYDGHPRVDDAGAIVVFESAMGVPYGGAGVPGGTGSAGSAGSAYVREETPRTTLWQIGADGLGLDLLVQDRVSARRPAISGSGEAVVYAARDVGSLEQIILLDRETGHEIALTDGDVAAGNASVDFDGDVIAWERHGAEESIAGAVLVPASLKKTTTDSLGLYAFDFPAGAGVSIDAGLRGLFVRVRDLAPGSPDLRRHAFEVVPTFFADLLFNPTGAGELPTTQVTAYQRVDAAHGHASDILSKPSFGLALPLPIDVQHRVQVNDPTGKRNAFYDPVTQASTFFVSQGPGAPNTAFDTILYHEYFHWVDDRFGFLYTPEKCGHTHTVTESLADVGALSMSGGATIGAGFEGPGTVVRDYGLPVGVPGGAGTRQLDGKDCRHVKEAGKKVPEPHDHGQAFAGFYNDLRGLVGAALADDLVFAAFAIDPPDMNSAVMAMFVRDADPAAGFGGTGDPASAPHYAALCVAAARHGFDCWPRPDLGSEGCWTPACAGMPPAAHLTTDTEWLGATVSPQVGCDPMPAPADEDGVMFDPILPMGDLIPITVTVSVNPALEGSGRYGGIANPKKPKPNRLRHLYLNAWLIVLDPMGEVEDVVHVLGTGSTSPDAGPDGFDVNTVAFDPETWSGSSFTSEFGIEVPAYPEDRVAILRVRLDHGEDAGVLDAGAPFWRRNCHGDPALAGPCGPARFGEVEDYQVLLVGE